MSLFTRGRRTVPPVPRNWAMVVLSGISSYAGFGPWVSVQGWHETKEQAVAEMTARLPRMAQGEALLLWDERNRRWCEWEAETGYAVVSGAYSGYSVHALFTTRERAEAYCRPSWEYQAKVRAQGGYVSDYSVLEIEEYPIDPDDGVVQPENMWGWAEEGKQ